MDYSKLYQEKANELKLLRREIAKYLGEQEVLHKRYSVNQLQKRFGLAPSTVHNYTRKYLKEQANGK